MPAMPASAIDRDRTFEFLLTRVSKQVAVLKWSFVTCIFINHNRSAARASWTPSSVPLAPLRPPACATSSQPRRCLPCLRCAVYDGSGIFSDSNCTPVSAGTDNPALYVETRHRDSALGRVPRRGLTHDGCRIASQAVQQAARAALEDSNLAGVPECQADSQPAAEPEPRTGSGLHSCSCR